MLRRLHYASRTTYAHQPSYKIISALATRPRADLKAVIVVANPDGLEDYKLVPTDVAGEVARSQTSLEGIATTVIARSIGGQAASLTNLAAAS